MAILIGRIEGGDDPRIPNYDHLGAFYSPESEYRDSIMEILNQISNIHRTN